MASVKTSGDQTAILGTEHTLATVTDAGTYQLIVDAVLLANGETLTLRIYGKAHSDETERLMWEANFSHALTIDLLASVPIVSPHHMKVTLEQNGGTGRAYPWAVYEL